MAGTAAGRALGHRVAAENQKIRKAKAKRALTEAKNLLEFLALHSTWPYRPTIRELRPFTPGTNDPEGRT